MILFLIVLFLYFQQVEPDESKERLTEVESMEKQDLSRVWNGQKWKQQCKS